MKKITSKKVAKALAKIVGNGLKVGGAVALGVGGLAGCESTPVYQTLAIYEGPVVRYYEGVIGKDFPVTYFVVETNGNPSERHIAVWNGRVGQPPYSYLKEDGATVRFRWTENDEKYGTGSASNIILINGEVVNYK